MDMNTIANIIVFLILPWFLPLLLAVCLYWYKRLIASLPVAQRAEAVRITQMAVNAVEQAMGGSPGTAKRQIAIDNITKVLNAAKINVSPDLIGMALEETVHAMNTPLAVTPAPMPAVPTCLPQPQVLAPAVMVTTPHTQNTNVPAPVETK